MKIPAVIQAIESVQFDKVSPVLGPVKVTLTQIEAGSQHNVVPSEVRLVIDVRVNECYTNSEIEQYLKAMLPCEINARSLRLKSSSIDVTHPLIKTGIALGKKIYGSPTLSDQAALDCPSLKLGPGDSTRSHSADEFIYIKEIEDGIAFYIDLLKNIL
jgi:acetylornithine deacetylase